MQNLSNSKAQLVPRFPELDKQLTGLGDWAKENPGKTAAIIGVLTVLGGIAGGPVGVLLLVKHLEAVWN